MSDTPDDLLTSKEAAKICERSPRTVRRWVSDGTLKGYTGPTPDGGMPPVLVSKSDLMKHLAVSEQKPAKPSGSLASKASDTAPDKTTGQTDNSREFEPFAVQLAELRGELEVERMRGKLMAANLETKTSTLEAKLTASNDRANAVGLELDRTRSDLAGARSDITEWKERYDALAAELTATRALLQQEQGMTVWQRLITGPTKPALPES